MKESDFDQPPTGWASVVISVVVPIATLILIGLFL